MLRRGKNNFFTRRVGTPAEPHKSTRGFSFQPPASTAAGALAAFGSARRRGAHSSLKRSHLERSGRATRRCAPRRAARSAHLSLRQWREKGFAPSCGGELSSCCRLAERSGGR